MIYHVEQPQATVVIFENGVITTIDVRNEQAVKDAISETVERANDLGLVELNFRELIEAGQTARLYEDETVWKDIIRTNVLFNFVQQLKHLGVLAPETRSHSRKIGEYEPAEKPWVLGHKQTL